MIEPPTVGDVLRRTLDAQAVSQVELAEHSGLSTKHVNQVLQGAVDLSLDVAVRFGRATGVPAQVWLGIAAARRDWELSQMRAEPAGRVMPKLRAQRDAALAECARLKREIERLRAEQSASDGGPR